MRRLRDFNYDTTPGVKDALKQLIKALIRKYYIKPAAAFERRMVRRRFNKTKRMIGQFYLKKQTTIPKIIHYIWVGGNKKPASVEQYIASWKKYCPDYLIVEWNEKNYDITVNRYTREAYRSKKWAFVTDYMRLDLLDQFGGIYVDSDVEILKSLDHFLDEEAFTSFETGDPSQTLMPTGMMAAAAGNRWIRYLKTYYDNDRPFILADGSFDLNANTVTITRMTREKYGIRMDNTLQRTEDFVLYPSDYFCPKSWSTGKITLTKNSHTIHHFAGSWKEKR
ncbi:MAG: capsular polysaccharide synthesis protein [Candidatus Saccharibacteria bacterium]|nr:capsular polysaccharide synthesis protein [Candidatus Saccharibacteria bacterium]